MATLGIGVRVYVGWTAKVNRSGDVRLCAIGRIKSGPYPPGFEGMERRSWSVDMGDRRQLVVEQLLTPIDDDGGQAEPRAVEVTETEVA